MMNLVIRIIGERVNKCSKCAITYLKQKIFLKEKLILIIKIEILGLSQIANPYG